MYLLIAVAAFFIGNQVAKSIATMDETQVEKIEMYKQTKEKLNEK